jgi:hypothetical protein
VSSSVRFNYYHRLTRTQQSIYRKSDAVRTVHLPRHAALSPIVAEIESSLSKGEQAAIQRACQALAGELANRFGVPPVQVVVLATRPVLRDGADLYGLYEPAENGKPVTVSVWMRTSQRKKVVAFRTFLRTLVHEFCHHLDYEFFKLAETFHTAGFYQRESSLMRQLLAPTNGEDVSMFSRD